MTETKKKHYHPIVVVNIDYTSSRQIKEIRGVLQALLTKPDHCPNCGGLEPELSFSFQGKQFCFTCYLIEETAKIYWDGKKETKFPRKTLTKTDYAKLGEYCKGKKE
jgi:hypothetical protein